MLRANGALHTVRLHSNAIGDDGAAALGEALRTNTALRELDLQLNAIGARGADALRAGLTDNYTLRTLRLEHNHVTAALGQELGDDEKEIPAALAADISALLERNRAQAGIVDDPRAEKAWHSATSLARSSAR